MDKAFNFFRVFDLAFFVPGAVVLVGLWSSGLLDADSLRGEEHIPQVAQVIALSVSAILGSFLFGLGCHAVYRFVDYVVWVRKGRPEGDPWYSDLDKDEPKHELAMYFWYLRSTCWNTSVACGACCAMMIYAKWTGWAIISGIGRSGVLVSRA